jgi:hypothetical protein
MAAPDSTNKKFLKKAEASEKRKHWMFGHHFVKICKKEKAERNQLPL